MVKSKIKLWQILAIIAGILFIMNGGIPSLQSIFGLGDGYILLADSDSSVTELTTNLDWGGKVMMGNGHVSKAEYSFDGKYITGKSTEYQYFGEVVYGTDMDISIHGDSVQLSPKINIKGINYRANIKGVTLKILEDSYALQYSEIKNHGRTTRINYFDNLIEFVPSILNPDITVLYLNGEQIKEYDLSTYNEVRFSIYSSGFSGNPTRNIHRVEIINSRWKPMFSCVLKENDMIAYEPLSGGTSFSMFNLRYFDPSQGSRFCYDTPATIVSETASGVTSDFNAEIYNKLAEGKVLTIPEDQIWGMFYIFDAQKAGVTTRCDVLNEYYNVELNDCVKKHGVVTICSQGVFDPIRGECVAESDPTCLYNGQPLGTFNANLGVCEYIPSTAIKCPVDYPTYDPILDMCIAVKKSSDICDDSTDESYIDDNGNLVCYNIIKSQVIEEVEVNEEVVVNYICPDDVPGTMEKIDNLWKCIYVTNEIVMEEPVCPEGVDGTIIQTSSGYVCKVTKEVVEEVIKKIKLKYDILGEDKTAEEKEITTSTPTQIPTSTVDVSKEKPNTALIVTMIFLLLLGFSYSKTGNKKRK